MERFAQLVIRYRVAVVLSVALLTLAGGYSIVQFTRIESDISKYLPADDPVVIRFNQAGDRFGGTAVAMVGIETDNLFTHENLVLIDRLTKAFKEVNGVSWVVSLTNMDDVQEEIIDGEAAVAVSRLIDPDKIPKDQVALDKLRKYVLGKEQLVGTVVSTDGRVANMVCNITMDVDRVEAVNEIERRARELAPGHELYFSGFPFWMKSMSAMILHDMALLVPFVTLLVLGVLFLSFRSLRGVLLPISTVLISSVWAMGLMAALDIPITMMSNAVPTLLIALGTAYAIHLLHKYNEATEGSSISRTVSEVMLPILLAGLTTMIGFLSFLTSDLLFIQQTGVIAAFGIFSAMLIALTFLPAILSWQKPRRRSEQGVLAFNSLTRLADRAGQAVIRRRRPILILSLAIAIAAAAFIPSLDRRFDMVSYFPEGSEVRRADEMMREKLGGNVPVWVTLEGKSKHPFALKSMWLVEKFLRTLKNVGHPKSVASLIAEMNKVMTGSLAVPDTPQGVGNLWLNLEGKDVLKQFVDAEQENALIQAVCTSGDTAKLRKIAAQIDSFLDQLPARAQPVTLSGAKPEVAERARAATLDRVALMVALDLKFRLGLDDFSKQQVHSWLTEALQAKPPAAGPESYHKPLLAYMLSDESDLEFPNQSLAETVAGAAAARLAGGERNAQAIEGLIREKLPEDLLAEDPQAAGYLAKSLVAKSRDIDAQRRNNRLFNSLLERLPKKAASDKRLREDLQGDLSELSQPVAFLPVGAGEKPADLIETDLQQTGMHHISVNVDDRIVFSQLSSLALAGILAMLLLMIQFRSIIAGLLGMIPMGMTLLVNFGVMGALKIRLEPATVLIASMVVGVGIDYTIHLMSRARLELLKSGQPASALDVTLKTAGRAIMINALTVTAGQLVFLAGDLMPLRTFGALLALAMIVSAACAVTVMPAILMVMQPKFLKRSRAS